MLAMIDHRFVKDLERARESYITLAKYAKDSVKSAHDSRIVEDYCWLEIALTGYLELL